ncbi:MAG TPA: creatininase family protein [archaeon]|nr:creatininase family protein [archaeon]
MTVLNKTGQKVFLTDYTWKELSELPEKKELKFLLPLGATEEHGYHLPLGSDTLQASKVAQMAAQRVPGVIVMPEISYGSCVDTMNFCGTIHISGTTLGSLVTDIAESLYRHGFRKLVIFNGHGGNKGVADTGLREALHNLTPPGKEFAPDFDIYLLNAYERPGQQISPLVEGKDWGHACEIETSVMLVLAPEAVDMKQAVEEYMPGDSYTVWRVRDMKTVSQSGVHGAANLATPKKGKQVLELLVSDLVSLLERI